MRKGLTLIELSIVLVLIGLVIGGVFVGKDLISGAEFRAVISQVSAFNTAVVSFKTKFRALPGDMSNATTFWSSTADGNNSQTIDASSGLGAIEEYYAWQHLNLAELISGSYTGVASSIPRAKIGTGYFRLSYQTSVYGKEGHMFALSAMNSTSTLADKPVFSAKALYAFDNKMDDGLADSGAIMGFNEDLVPGCVTNDYTSSSGSYLSTSDSIKCKVFFVANF